MIKKETLLKMAGILKMDAAEFEAALNDAAEKEVTLPTVEVFTAQELATRDTSVKKTALVEGGTAAIEMFIKDKKKELGLEFEGKDPAKLLEAYQAKVLADAKLVPDEALKQKDTIIQGLRTNLTTLEAEKTAALGQIAKVKQEVTLKSSIPTNLSGVEPDEVLASMRLKGYDFVEEDGKMVVKKDGTLVADKALQPLPIADVIKGYATERKWLAVEEPGRQGRGAASSRAGATGGKVSTLKEAEEAWVAEGKNSGTADFQRHVEALAAANKDFDFNN